LILDFFSYPIHLLLNHGYIALFIWSIFEGEIGLMLAGWLVSQNKIFTYENIIIIAMIDALIGDTITFTIGRFFKKFALSWLNKHPDKKKLAENLIRQYGAFVIIFERFIYGTHIPVMLIF
jgi:membrane protein DedA with SNARE-associated domain